MDGKGKQPSKTLKGAAARSAAGEKMGGRPKGTPNKATANAREAIALFVDHNSAKLQGWLDDIAAQEGPKAAWNCLMDLIEYHVPKLQRTEVTGANGGPQEHSVTVNINAVRPKLD